jgi:DNA-directed RNA polymerase beta subunit
MDSAGRPRRGAVFHNGEKIIGYSRLMWSNDGKFIRRDASVTCKRDASHVDGVFDDVIPGTKNRVVRVRTREVREPELGDKLTSRHGQKGIIGRVMNQEDMPFDPVRGIAPDIIVNPHGMPSRMTIGQIVEMTTSLLATLPGATETRPDGTPFSEAGDDRLERLSRALVERGFHHSGKTLMMNGETGEPMESLIFMAPLYILRLRHMVRDKMHGRTRGPKNALTQQPVEGRSKDGGLRFGEQERDCALAHGATAFLKDRMLDQSDIYCMPTCANC